MYDKDGEGLHVGELVEGRACVAIAIGTARCPQLERRPQRVPSQHRVPRSDPVPTHHRQGRDLEPGQGPLRLAHGASAGGLFLGDYDGLTSSGTTFKALFDMSQPIATTGRSDTFSNSAG